MILEKLFGKKPLKTGSITTERHAAVQEVKTDTTQQQAGQQEPQSAEHLEKAMVDNVRNDDLETRKKVYQELLFSDLLLALADIPEQGDAPKTIQANNMNVAILTNGTGVHFAAAFTSPAAARRWRSEGGNYASIRGQDLYKLLEPSPAEVIVVNPGSVPYVVLAKHDYQQLSLGVIPQSPHSPVQTAATPETLEEEHTPNAEGQMQLAFPPDVFNDIQKEHTLKLLDQNLNIEAGVLGAVMPPGQDPEKSGWIRTLFLRVRNIPVEQQALQEFCLNIRNELLQKQEIFQDTNFEVAVMPDPQFWAHMHQNNMSLIDKNPPSSTAT